MENSNRIGSDENPEVIPDSVTPQTSQGKGTDDLSLMDRRRFFFTLAGAAAAVALHPLCASADGKIPERRADSLTLKDVCETYPKRSRMTTVEKVEDCECCVDDRCTHEVLGLTGGSLGGLAAAVTTLWKMLGNKLTPAMIQNVVDSYPGVLYLHTDKHAEHALAAALHPKGTSDRHDAHEPAVPVWPADAATNEKFLALLIEHMGCGHMQQMLAHADAYGTNADVIREMLKAVIRRQIKNPASVKKEVLQEEKHAARAVLIVEMEGGIKDGQSPVAVVKPCAEGIQCFVKHEGLGQYLIEQKVLPALKRAGIQLNEKERASFIQAAVKACDDQTNQTVGRLAGGLGVFKIKVNPRNPIMPIITDIGTVQAISA